MAGYKTTDVVEVLARKDETGQAVRGRMGLRSAIARMANKIEMTSRVAGFLDIARPEAHFSNYAATRTGEEGHRHADELVENIDAAVVQHVTGAMVESVRHHVPEEIPVDALGPALHVVAHDHPPAPFARLPHHPDHHHFDQIHGDRNRHDRNHPDRTHGDRIHHDPEHDPHAPPAFQPIDPQSPLHPNGPHAKESPNNPAHQPSAHQPPAHGNAHGGGFAKPPKAPELPPPPQTASQQAINQFIDKARKDRDEAKSKVKQQSLAKCTGVAIDAKAIEAKNKAENDAKIAKIREEAAKKKAEAQKQAVEKKQESTVTIASLKEKLESKLTADKEELKSNFEQKKAELKVRMDTQRKTLEEETHKQVENLQKQQEAKKKEAETAWNTQKTSLEKTATDLQRKMKEQVKKDEERFKQDKEKLEKAGNDRAEKIFTDAQKKAEKVVKDGETDAKKLLDQGRKDASQARAKGQSEAAGARASAKARADAQTDDAQKQSITNGAESQARTAVQNAEQRARDIEAKAKIAAEDVRNKAKKEAEVVTQTGRAESDKAKAAVTDQVKKIQTKIESVKKLADERIKKAEGDLKKQLADGETKLKEKLKGFTDRIEKVKKEGEEKLKKLEDGGEKNLQKEYDQALKAIDQKAEAARKQLATGTEKDVKRLEKMVDDTIKSIDKQVVDTNTRFDKTINDTEKKAQTQVRETLNKIKAEADKALKEIDKAYDEAMKKLDQAVESCRRSIEEMAKGKMLEIEVHIGTLLNDLGDSSRLDAVKKQLEWYIKNKKPLPAGYGEVAPPSDGAKKDEKEKGKEAELKKDDKDKKDGKDKDKKPEKEKDPKDWTPEELAQKVDEAVKRGQTDTGLAAAQAGEKRVEKAAEKATEAVQKTYDARSKQLDDLKNLPPGERDKDIAAGEKGAEEVQKALEKEGFLWGKSPDKKAILKALEGKTPDQIAAMRDALKAKGIDLDEAVNSNLSGLEKEEAQVRLKGDPMAGDIIKMRRSRGEMSADQKFWINATGVVGIGVNALLNVADGKSAGGSEPAEVNALIEKYSKPPDGSPEKLKEFAAVYEAQTGRRLSADVSDSLPADQAKQLNVPVVPEPDSRTIEQIRSDAEKKGVKVDQAGKAVNDLDAALNQGLHFQSTRGDTVEKILQGPPPRSPEEIALIKAEYNAKHAPDTLDAAMERSLEPGRLIEAKAMLRGDETQVAVGKLLHAQESAWTPWAVDDKKMQDALKEIKDPEQRRKVFEAYEKQTGTSIKDVIAHKMTGADREIAEAYADGDPLKAKGIQIAEAANGGWMNGLARSIAERGFGVKTKTGQVDPGPSFTVFGYEVSVYGGIHKVDSEKILDLLAETPNAADRERLKAIYKAETGRDLDADMQKKMAALDGSESDKLKAYNAYMEGKPDDAEAARAHDALNNPFKTATKWLDDHPYLRAGLAVATLGQSELYRFGAQALSAASDDKKAFYRALEGKNEEERKRFIEAFNKQYGNGDPATFDKFCKENLSGMDLEKAQLLAHEPDDPKTGVVKLPDEFVWRYAQDSIWVKGAKALDVGTKWLDDHPWIRAGIAIATLGQSEIIKGEAEIASHFMRGWGVDDQAMLGVLRGKSKEEIEELKKRIPGLAADIEYSLGGREAHEAKYRLEHGEPKTLEEKIAFQLDMKKFDRDGDPNSTWSKIAHGIDTATKFLDDHPWIRVGLAVATLGQSEILKLEAEGASYFIQNPNALVDLYSNQGKVADEEAAFLEQQRQPCCIIRHAMLRSIKQHVGQRRLHR